jgi:proline dehydrogenase
LPAEPEAPSIPSSHPHGFAANPLAQEELHQTPPDKRQRKPFMPLNFSDYEEASKPKSTLELARAYGVFTTCQIKPLVKHADSLLDLSRKVVGSTIVNALVRETFFNHFCAGEDSDGIRPKLRMLHQNGIGSIMDYAAEDDVSSEAGPASRSDPHGTVIARTFDYGSEAACDGHMNIFLKSIEAAADAPGQGFAAIKVTALGNPKLLERVSAGLVAIRNLFTQFDLDMNNVIGREEFTQVYSQLFSDATEERVSKLFRYLDADDCGYVDYLSWSKRIRLQDIPNIIKHCRAPGPLYLSKLSEEELRLLNNMMRRLYTIAEAAAERNVRLMIDAEHTYFQPAIDHAAVELQRKFNQKEPVVLNTYQCYLKDSGDRLLLDMERARREGWKFGAKLVRGAYMYLERARAEELHYPSPVWDSLDETHANYNRCLDVLVKSSLEEGSEVMIATHNQKSIERAVALMYELGIEPFHAGVYFGQLLGMADHLTFILGRNGYRAYKYVPFGPIEEVMPYLIRRAQENSDIMAGVDREKRMIRGEIWRRVKSRLTGSLPKQQHAAAAAVTHSG